MVLLVGCSTGHPPSACDNSNDISAGGTFMGNTCNAPDGSANVVTGNGCANTPVSLFQLRPHPVQYDVVFHVSDGYGLATRSDVCAFSADCAASFPQDYGESNPRSDHNNIVVFQRDGGCGAFRLDVHNADHCADGGCTCGSTPECPAGQYCANGTGTCNPL